MGIENPVHLAFIAIVALVVLGPKRLPELARSLGHGMREFREAMSAGADGDHELHSTAETQTPISAFQAETAVVADGQQPAAAATPPAPAPAAVATPPAPTASSPVADAPVSPPEQG